MKTILTAILALASSACLAQQGNFYIGGSLGISMADIDEAGFSRALTDTGFTNSGASSDESGTGLKLYVGYRAHRNFAVEGGYVDLGEFSAQSTVTAVNGVPVVPGTISAKIKSKDGFHLSALALLPIENSVQVFGKLGVYSVKLDSSVTVSGVGGTATVPGPSDTSTGPIFGAGIMIDIDRQFSVRAEFERFRKVGSESSTGESDIDLLSAGLVYRF